MPTPSPHPRGAGLSHSIANELKQLIYSGEFQPGDRLQAFAVARHQH